VYRMFLKFSFWLGNLSAKYQWAFIVGLYLGTQGLSKLADQYASLKPFLVPVVIVLTLFAFSTWVIKPVSNLFLRFNAYGKFLLNKQEKMSSNFVAISLVVLLAGLFMYIYSSQEKYIVLAAYGFVMMVLCGVMFLPSKNNSIMIYTISMAVLGLIAIWMAFTNNAAAENIVYAFFIGFIAFQWLANFLVIRSSNK